MVPCRYGEGSATELHLDKLSWVFQEENSLRIQNSMWRKQQDQRYACGNDSITEGKKLKKKPIDETRAEFI